MAVLTETAHAAHGNTVLYIPAEDLHDPATAARDHALVQRLDTIVVHWTRQVKDVLNRQSSIATSHDGGERTWYK